MLSKDVQDAINAQIHHEFHSPALVEQYIDNFR